MKNPFKSLVNKYFVTGQPDKDMTMQEFNNFLLDLFSIGSVDSSMKYNVDDIDLRGTALYNIFSHLRTFRFMSSMFDDTWQNEIFRSAISKKLTFECNDGKISILINQNEISPSKYKFTIRASKTNVNKCNFRFIECSDIMIHNLIESIKCSIDNNIECWLILNNIDLNTIFKLKE